MQSIGPNSQSNIEMVIHDEEGAGFAAQISQFLSYSQQFTFVMTLVTKLNDFGPAVDGFVRCLNSIFWCQYLSINNDIKPTQPGQLVLAE